MSFVITMYVREGIVMAADSRLTLNHEERRDSTTVVNLSVGQSDSNYKLFLSPCGIGISTFGAADIQGVPIAGYVESFMRSHLGQSPSSVGQAADELAAHFRDFDPRPSCQFHVAGYCTSEEGEPVQEVWHVDVASGLVEHVNRETNQGASWGGEADILGRLIQPLAQLDEQGQVTERLPYFPIPWGFFTLQDAIDFAVFAVRSTIEAIRFLPRPKTVGGPIDVLVIRPDGTAWVQRKELRVDQ
jgi:hypothetical protein